MLPNLIIVGAARSGTTSLHRYLDQHPQIFMSKPKETNFFCFKNNTPPLNGPFDDFFLKKCIVNQKDYEDLFIPVREGIIIRGESSPCYLQYPSTAKNIKKTIPDCKIIISLRDPIERCFSHFRLLTKLGHETLTFEEALNAEKERLNKGWRADYQYTANSHYYDKVNRYLSIFGEDNVEIILFEELIKNSHRKASDIFRFLGINDSVVISEMKQHNYSGFVRSKIIQKYFLRPHPIKKVAKIIPRQIRTRIYDGLKSYNTVKTSQTLDEKTKDRLTKLFSNDIINLEKLIGRDLNNWLN
jgi:hypothetical protein